MPPVNVGTGVKPRVFDPSTYNAAQAGGAVGGTAPSPYAGQATPGGAAPGGGPTGATPTPAAPLTPSAPSPMSTTTPIGTWSAPGAPSLAPAQAPPPMTNSATGGGSALDPNFLNGNANRFKNAAASAVQGYGDMAGEDMTRNIGMMLGDLNGIGGLRSGGVQAGVDQASKEYGRQIGDYSKMTATDAIKMGQEENDLNIERQWRQKMYDAAQAASKRRGLGQLLGAVGTVAGAVFGGPVGASIGGAVGSAIGGGG